MLPSGMLPISTSVVQLPWAWSEEHPDRFPEVESLGHTCIYGDDCEQADLTIADEDGWDAFLCEFEHPWDVLEYGRR